MDIKVDLNTTEVRAWVRKVFEDQVPFATSVAINQTAKDFQASQRERMEDIFEVRRKTFMSRAVKVKPFSTKRSLAAKVGIDPPGGERTEDIITKFENQRMDRPHKGKSLAVPAAVRRTPSGVIRKDQRPKAFALEEVGRGPRATTYAGKKRVFMIRFGDGTGAIYRRTGRKRAGARLASDIATRRVRDMNIDTLYRFTPQATITRRLEFTRTAQRVVTARFADNFAQAFDRAIGLGDTRQHARRIALADVFGRDRRRI